MGALGPFKGWTETPKHAQSQERERSHRNEELLLVLHHFAIACNSFPAWRPHQTVLWTVLDSGRFLPSGCLAFETVSLSLAIIHVGSLPFSISFYSISMLNLHAFNLPALSPWKGYLLWMQLYLFLLLVSISLSFWDSL